MRIIIYGETDIGGDVKGDVWAGYSSTVIVEGNAEGNVLADETPKIYLGGNDGAEITEGKDSVYFTSSSAASTAATGRT